MAKHLLTALCLLLTLSACERRKLDPTPYQAAGADKAYGYVERASATPGTYELQVRGNRDTPPELLEGYFIRRASELCTAGVASQTAKREAATIIRDRYIGHGLFMPGETYSDPLVTGVVTCK
jgi:hypothetical protein